jgi:hypothetical protein
MAKPRHEVELWLIVTDPARAREFIRNYDWGLPPNMAPDRVYTESGRVILFKEMSDEDAVVAATAILRDVEVPQVLRTRQLEMWEQ